MTTTMMIQVRPARRDSSYIIIITIIIKKHIVHFLFLGPTLLYLHYLPSQTIHLPVSLTPRLHFALSPLSLLRVGST